MTREQPLDSAKRQSESILLEEWKQRCESYRQYQSLYLTTNSIVLTGGLISFSIGSDKDMTQFSEVAALTPGSLFSCSARWRGRVRGGQAASWTRATGPAALVERGSERCWGNMSQCLSGRDPTAPWSTPVESEIAPPESQVGDLASHAGSPLLSFRGSNENWGFTGHTAKCVSPARHLWKCRPRDRPHTSRCLGGREHM